MNDVVNETILGQVFDGELGHLGLSHTGWTKNQNWDVAVGISFDEKLLHGNRLVADDNSRPIKASRNQRKGISPENPVPMNYV
jgi:hypothetical protein